MSQAFVIPHGVVFAITDDGVVIENAGDVELHTDFGGRRMARVVSHQGNIRLDAHSLDAGEVIAGGEVSTTGALRAQSVQAQGGTLPALDVASLNLRGDGAIAGHLRADQADVGGNLAVGSVVADGLRVGGDLHVQSTLEARVLQVGGTITVGGAFSFDVLEIAGTIRFQGDVSGKTLIADVIELGTGTVTVRGLQARTRIVIGAARLTVDAIVAPQVLLDPGATGRATVIESQNEVARAGIKGGFRLADVGEMFGNADAFLAERGLSPLSAPDPSPTGEDAVWSPAAVTIPQAPVEVEAAVEVEAQIEEEAPVEVEAAVEVEAQIEEEAPDEAEAAVEAEAAPPIPDADPLATAIEHPLHAQLATTIQRIVDCYAGAELPPAVERLRTLVDACSYPDIRAEITNIWSELLKYHQKKGIRIHHQVTTTFNSVNSLVKKM
ncbi:MAG: hypothetical protein EXR71_07365 [Myxococcales bacterium]|nr:hypothetical protein [Myxococcales bacterium]